MQRCDPSVTNGVHVRTGVEEELDRHTTGPRRGKGVFVVFSIMRCPEYHAVVLRMQGQKIRQSGGTTKLHPWGLAGLRS
ncbi:hypothetical protein J2S97_001502 [Arthrobacter oryzae]|nr:hypothetical protein [Arthrobacter oryzae]